MVKDSMQRNSTNPNPGDQDRLSILQALQVLQVLQAYFNEENEIQQEVDFFLDSLDFMVQRLKRRKTGDLKLTDKEVKRKEELVKLVKELEKVGVGVSLVFAVIIFMMFLVMGIMTMAAFVIWIK